MPRAAFKSPEAPSVSGRPLVLGHRGASADAPENTIAAFRLALEQGADGVELDVWRCGSGEPVVIHDATTGRTGGLAVPVRRAPLHQLASLDVGEWKGRGWRGERIPTLARVLAELPGAVVNVELKSSGVADPRLAQAVAQVIRSARAGERVVVSSFDLALLAAFRCAAPELAVGVLFASDQDWRVRELLGRALVPAAVHPDWDLLQPPRVERWRSAGLAVNVWTLDAPDAVAQACSLRVTAVITNRPGAARDVVRRHTGR